jgi:RsiW-degrading membrane proteinase PrsW (M82 family)
METHFPGGAPPRMPAPTLPGHPLVPEPVAPLMPHAPHRRHRYRVVLVVGLAVFAALTAAAGSSGSTIAIAGVLLVGSFFVPVVYVLYVQEIDMLRAVPLSVLLRVGLLTAVIALPSAAVVEAFTGAGMGGVLPAFATGLIEEAAKLVVLLWLVRRTKFRYELDGVIFGAAAGMAFAGFENVVYALGSLNESGLNGFLGVLWLRQVLGPFGHGTWTAAIAAVIWRERFTGPGKLDRKVLFAYLTSSALHGLWDWAPLPGIGAIAWWVVIGVVSVVVLRHRIREAVAQRTLPEPAEAPAAVPQPAAGAAPGAPSAGPQLVFVSPDTRYVWNGSGWQWRTQPLSPDGRYLWDGRHWWPVAAAT